MEELTEREKRMLGAALFIFSMKLGLTGFDEIEAIAAKLGVTEELLFVAKDFIEFNKKQNETRK